MRKLPQHTQCCPSGAPRGQTSPRIIIIILFIYHGVGRPDPQPLQPTSLSHQRRTTTSSSSRITVSIFVVGRPCFFNCDKDFAAITIPALKMTCEIMFLRGLFQTLPPRTTAEITRVVVSGSTTTRSGRVTVSERTRTTNRVSVVIVVVVLGTVDYSISMFVVVLHPPPPPPPPPPCHHHHFPYFAFNLHRHSFFL